MNANYDPVLLRLETVGSSPQEADNMALAKNKLRKLGKRLLIAIAVSAIISYLPSFYSDAGEIFQAAQILANLIIIGLFIFSGLYFFIFLAKNKKDYSGGYLELYKDYMVIKQRSRFSNDDRWESASIWYKDILRMWNTTDKSNSRILRENRDVERYTDGVCFEYISGRGSHSISVAQMGNKLETTIFRLNCDGYAKTAILDAAKTIHDAARAFNPKLEYHIL